MKKHKYWTFKSGPLANSTGFREEWWGDCIKWRNAVKKSRPDLVMETGIAFGPRSTCAACISGLDH